MGSDAVLEIVGYAPLRYREQNQRTETQSEIEAREAEELRLAEEEYAAEHCTGKGAFERSAHGLSSSLSMSDDESSESDSDSDSDSALRFSGFFAAGTWLLLR